MKRSIPRDRLADGVVLDACVLYPISLCDVLLSTAARGLYRLLWTDRILGETRGALIRNGLSEAKVDYRVSTMEAVFPEASVTEYEALIDTMRNDVKDRHVLAAAVHAGTGFIVTMNLRDFPASVLEPLGIEALHPDAFLMELFRRDAGRVLSALTDLAASKSRPPMTVLDLLERLAKNVPAFAGVVRQRVEKR